MAVAYAEDAVTGRVEVCKYARLACQRMLDDLGDQGTDEFPYVLDTDKANRVCSFVELCQHVKGPLTGQTIRLEPWQCFVLVNVFGWVHDRGSLNGKRRFRKSYICVPRGNAKSTLSAALGLYLVACDGEGGAECYTAACTRDQARIIFDDSQQMCRKNKQMQTALGLQVNADTIIHPQSGSKYKPLASEGDTLDGLNIHVALIDELAQHRTRDVYDVLITGAAKRDQSLLWAITTAGANVAGIAYETQSYLYKILDRVVDDESFFGMVYTLDEGDVWNDEKVWRKANPNYGVSVFPDALKALATKAQVIPSQQAAFRTKHLNEWLSSDAPYFDMLAWRKCGDPNLRIEDFRGENCVMGLDLATKSDLAAKVLLFPKMLNGEKHYYVFGVYYLPETAVEDNRNASYHGWVVEGQIKPTPGSVTDFHVIKDDILEDCRTYAVQSVPYDPYQAQYMEQELINEGIPVIEYKNTVANMSFAMKEMQALILKGRIHHDGNNCLGWQISNVVAHLDAKDNVFPRKERPELKIDGPVAIMMALGVSLSTEESNVFVEWVQY
jgi:phage terminase large subunit-like protein